MKTNHDGTITLNASNSWTSCLACGQRVTGDSIHTCSPQIKELTDRIAELEKGSKPIGHLYPEDGATVFDINFVWNVNDTKEPIPLYTTPQKYCPSENNASYEKGVIDGMAKQRQSRVDGIIGQIGDSPIHDLVHRTTPQIKELSDEEIMQVAENSFTARDGKKPLIEFARAILKKASEK